MRKILNKNLRIHIKIPAFIKAVAGKKDKHHPINIGLVIVVILASITTWFLTEYIVYELNQMDLAVMNWVNEARPRAKAAVEVHYVTQNGAGAKNGSSLANAWSVAQFNALTGTGYAGDTFYFSGTFTTRITVTGLEGTSGNPIILDGYQAGNCDPINTTCSSSADLKAGMGIGSGVAGPDYITIQDFRMTNPAYNITTLDVRGTSADKCSYIIVQRNYVYMSGGTMFNLMESTYSLVENNKFYVYGQSSSAADVPRGFCTQKVSDIIIRGNEIGHDEVLYPSYPSSAEMWELHQASKLLIENNNIYGAANQSGIRPKEQSPGNNNLIIRFNKIHHNNNGSASDAGIHIHTDVNSSNRYMYIYGNQIYNNHMAGIMLGNYVDHIYIWSNVIFSNDRSGVLTWSLEGGHTPASYVYIYNNTFARNGDKEESDTNRGGIVIQTGTNINIKSNILWNNRPGGVGSKYNQIYSGINLSSLEHNTYYHSLSVPILYYSGAFQTLTTMQSSYGFENDAPAGIITNPGFVDPNGPDNIYGTHDDVYTLDGSYINTGADIPQCFDVSVQGQNHHICYSDALDPIKTNWSTTPPTVYTLNQNDHGSGWERGAYVYP